MTFRHLARLISCAGLALLPCAAQEGESVTLRFLSFPRAIDPAPVELVAGEGKTIKVEIPSNELSEPCKVKRQANWVVGETVKGTDGKPVFKVFGQAAALASSEQLLLLIRKGKDHADGFEVIPIDYRSTEFGPGKFSIIKPKGEAGDNKLVHTTLYFRKDDQPKPFFSSTWPLSDAARSLIFFYHDPDTNRLRLHSIRDFP